MCLSVCVYIPTHTVIHLCKMFCDPHKNTDFLRAKYEYCFIVAGKQLSISRALLANGEQK